MAAGLRGKHTKIWIGGYQLTVKMRDIKASLTYDELAEDGYSEDHSTLKGQANSVINLDGYFGRETVSTHQALKDLSDSGIIVSAGFGENAAVAQGDIAISLKSQQINYEIVPALSDVIAVAAQMNAKGIPLEFGIILADQEGVSANGNTNSVDDGASSSNGAVGYLHLTGVSAGDTITVKIQDSADDAAWADLITFTLDGSAIGAERVAVSGNVDRYVRALWTVTGTGISFDFAINFLRK